MGVSYQDIETRLKTIELMTEFIMKAFQVNRPNPFDPYGRPMVSTLLEEYIRTMQAKPVDLDAMVRDQKALEGEVVDAPGVE